MPKHSKPANELNAARNAFFTSHGLLDGLVFMIGETANHTLNLSDAMTLSSEDTGYGFTVEDRTRPMIVGLAQNDEGPQWIKIQTRKTKGQTSGKDPRTSNGHVSFSLTEQGSQHYQHLMHAMRDHLAAAVPGFTEDSAMRDDVRERKLRSEMTKAKDTDDLPTQVGQIIIAHRDDPDVMRLMKKFPELAGLMESLGIQSSELRGAE